MKTNKYWITNGTAVDFSMKIKIADITWVEGSNRPDDWGSVYVAPVCEANWSAPLGLGLVMVYATTNGDPVALAQIEDGELTWFEESSSTPGIDNVRPILARANWIHDPAAENYSFLVMESV